MPATEPACWRTSAETSTAPRTAAIETGRPRSFSVTIAKTAAALAPTLTPMMSGLASGLRNVVWKIAPPTPKASPTSTPRTARGSLLSIRM